MKTKINWFIFSWLCVTSVLSQELISTKELQPDKEFENLFSKQLAGDSLVSSFVIWIKHSVTEHRHLEHSEHIYVLEGEAEMTIGEKKCKIAAGDFIFVPKNTWHSVAVSSAVPLKVLSIQAPYFDGTDRLFKK